MTDLKTVFIVTSGEYSEYRIESVWVKREDAEAAAARWGNAWVEEWVLNTTSQERTMVQWRARIVGEGEIVVDEKPFENREVRTTEVNPYRGQTFTFEGGLKPSFGFRGTGWGPSPEHARKSLSDALAKARAEQIELRAAGTTTV